ncbi:MAG: cobalt ECF transporter T component CbiQ [Deltaproteobacteria bacterium]|nr:cobalt ECF transporter T component CbiQ [Deltaproteobacteria bacterium]MBW1962019.1 cobalt ECF transporter T component CbiQ [Deltaproteobacteria bacterium]MBW1995358.1 cobalt ECF transporter T component CbiQ [Deltaproteobacteria bacterium]MBW2153445.1 cobalt ECF transporter T component CbiQ [Deltaproteobacteria bacterium]
MITEPFSTGTSFIHRIDPRLKIVYAAALSFVVAVSTEFPTLIAALALSVLMVVLARLNYVGVLRRIAVVLGFVLLIWVVLPFTFEGETLFEMGPLKLMRPGVMLSAQISLKSAAISLSFMALVATMTIGTLGHAMNELHMPDKIVFLLLISYRYLFVIAQEYERLLRAIKMRGFRPKTDLHTYKTFAYLVGMLFVRASDRAVRVHQAMKCRGFKGKFVTLHTFSADRRNVIFAGFMSAAVMGLSFLEWGLKIVSFNKN